MGNRLNQVHSFTLKQRLRENRNSFLKVHQTMVRWYAAYNVWKVINCWESDGLGFATFACPDHPGKYQRAKILRSLRMLF